TMVAARSAAARFMVHLVTGRSARPSRPGCLRGPCGRTDLDCPNRGKVPMPAGGDAGGAGRACSARVVCVTGRPDRARLLPFARVAGGHRPRGWGGVGGE